MQGQVFVGPQAQVAESTIYPVPCVPHRHACLAERVSLIFRRDDLSIGDVGAEVNTAIDEIAKLAIACGKLESRVHNLWRPGEGLLGRERLKLP